MIYFFVILVLLLICVLVIGAISDFTLALLVYIFNHPIGISALIFILIFILCFHNLMYTYRWKKFVKAIDDQRDSSKVYIPYVNGFFGFRVYRMLSDVRCAEIAMREGDASGEIVHRNIFYVVNRPFYASRKYKSECIFGHIDESTVNRLLFGNFGEYKFFWGFSEDYMEKEYYNDKTKKKIIISELPIYEINERGGWSKIK